MRPGRPLLDLIVSSLAPAPPVAAVVAILVGPLLAGACGGRRGPTAPVSPSNSGAAAGDAGGSQAAAPGSGCVLPEGRGPLPAAVLDDPVGRARVDTSGSPCRRRFTLSSTAPRRDDLPASPRVIEERADRPVVRTRNDLFDALYALAQDEAIQASVASIHDGAFDQGRPRACPPGGCFETGRKWTYVWTRDTSYSVDLALAALDPVRARNSLEFKLSERRAGGDLEIVQDTGSGGSYPISTDRVVWALGASRLIDELDGAHRTDFMRRAGTAVANTALQDRALVFDPDVGLYRGEESFLDWREQTYPAWTAHDTIAIGMSQALSTNVGHLRALELAAELTGSDRYAGWARDLRAAIATRFAVPGTPLLASYRPGGMDPAPARRFDLLGQALAVLSGVVPPDRAAAMVAAYPELPAGPPVVWPEEPDVPVYHNRAVWPFATAYWLLAARAVRNDAAVDHGVASLMRGAALNLSNMENLEALSGRAWVDDGPRSGPVVDSQRQLWSVAGYLAMVERVVFGRETTREGIRFAPYVTRAMRRDLFGASDTLVLAHARYRGARLTVVVHLPPVGTARGGAYQVGAVRLDGRPVGTGFVPESALGRAARFDVELVDRPEPGARIHLIDPDSHEAVYAPPAPSMAKVTARGGHLALAIDRRGAPADRVGLRIYRDGELVADDLPGRTATWIDRDAGPGGPSHCYTAEAFFRSSGATSHRARPVCWLGPQGHRRRTVPLTPTRAAAAGAGARTEAAGLAEARAALRVGHAGRYLVRLIYRNPGPINTGVTCAVRRIDVSDLGSSGDRVGRGHGHGQGRRVASGRVVLPHTGTQRSGSGGGGAGRSSILRLTLEAGHHYQVTVSSDRHTVNMSAFAHFEHYTGGAGGADGARNSAVLEAVELTYLGPG